MTVFQIAGLGGIGFVVVAIVVNVVYVRARLPLPVAGKPFDTVAREFAEVGERHRLPSAFVPAGWLFLTVFASGLTAMVWDHGPPTRAWAMVGFAGVLMQNATFVLVEALRFAMAAAAKRDRSTVAGLWVLSNVVFGFNQLFLATAMLGFTAAGQLAGFVAPWHAVLGYGAAAILFITASASPYNAEGASRLGGVGLVGWLGWAAWIVGYSITMSAH